MSSNTTTPEASGLRASLKKSGRSFRASLKSSERGLRSSMKSFRKSLSKLKSKKDLNIRSESIRLSIATTDEEQVIKMIEQLSQEFDKDEVQKLSKSWIRAVMSQPDKKKKDCRRSFEYSKKKLSEYLRWRKKSNVTSKIAYNLKNDPRCDDADEQKVLSKKKNKTEAIKSASPGSLYWFGTDSQGSPILWYHADRTKFRKCNTKNEMEYTSIVIQAALDVMPENIHSFNFIVFFDKYDVMGAATRPNLAPSFVKTFMAICPDRLKSAYMVAGSLGHVFYKLAGRLAPASIMDKVVETRSREDTADLLVQQSIITSNEVPNFMGGSFVHDNEISENFPVMIKAIQEKMSSK